MTLFEPQTHRPTSMSALKLRLLAGLNDLLSNARSNLVFGIID